MDSLIGTLRRWPSWAPLGAQYWGVLYGALAMHWLLGGRSSFPIANVRDQPAGGSADAVAPASLLLLGAVIGVLSARGTSRRAMAGVVVATAAALLGTFGLALSGVGVIAAGTIERPLALGAQLRRRSLRRIGNRLGRRRRLLPAAQPTSLLNWLRRKLQQVATVVRRGGAPWPIGSADRGDCRGLFDKFPGAGLGCAYDVVHDWGWGVVGWRVGLVAVTG